MFKRTIPGFGSGVIPGAVDAPVRFAGSKRIYGVRIGSMSPIDQCFVSRGGAIDPWAVQTAASAPVGTQNAYGTQPLGGSLNAHKLSVERPLIVDCQLDELTFIPANTYPTTFGSHAIELEFLDSPAEVGMVPTKRAPLEVPESRVITTNNTAFVIPTFGRKNIWAEIDITADGGNVVTYDLYGWNFWYDVIGSTWRESATVLIPIASGTTDLKYQGDGPFNFLVFVVRWTAGVPRFAFNIRAED